MANRPQYIIDIIANDKKLRQQMAGWNWKKIMGADGQAFGDLLADEAGHGAEEVKKAFNGLNIDWTKILGTKQMEQLEQALAKTLQKSKHEINVFANKGDTAGVEKMIQYVSALGDEFANMGSNFDAKQITRSMNSLMTALSSDKIAQMAVDTEQLTRAFEKLFNRNSTNEADKLATAMAKFNEEAEKSARTVVRKLHNSVNTVVGSISEKLGKLSEIKVDLILDEASKDNFKTSINNFINELNEHKNGNINEVKVTLDLNEPEKTTNIGRPKSASKKQIEAAKADIQKAIDDLQKKYDEVKSVLEHPVRGLNEQLKNDPTNAVLQGHINKANEELVSIAKTMESYNHLLSQMDDYEFAKYAASDWKRFSSAAQNVLISQSHLLTETRKWRNEMNDALKFKYQFKLEGSDAEFEDLAWQFEQMAAKRPLQLTPDIDYLANAIEQGLAGREIKVKLAANGTVNTSGVVGNLGVVPGRVVVRQDKPMPPTPVAPKVVTPVTQEAPKEQSHVYIDSEIGAIIKSVEAQLAVKKSLEELYAELLKDAGITDKEVVAYVDAVKDKKITVPKEIASKYGTEKIFLDKLQKTKKAVNFNSKVPFFNVTDGILQLKKVIDENPNDEAKVKSASEQIKTLLVQSVVESFKTYSEKSKKRYAQNEQDIIEWTKVRDAAKAAYDSDAEKKKRSDAIAAKQQEIAGLESNTAISEYEAILQLIKMAKTEGDTASLEYFSQQEREVLPAVKKGYQDLIEARKQLNELHKQDPNDVNLQKIAEAEHKIASLTRSNAKITRSRQEYENIGVPLGRLEELVSGGKSNDIYDLIVEQILSKPNVVQSMGSKRKTSDAIDPMYLFDTTNQKLITATVDMVQKAFGMVQKTNAELDRRVANESLLSDVRIMSAKRGALSTVMGSSFVVPKETFDQINSLFESDLAQAREMGDSGASTDREKAYVKFAQALDRATKAADAFRGIYDSWSTEDRAEFIKADNKQEWFNNKYKHDETVAASNYAAYIENDTALKHLKDSLSFKEPNHKTGERGQYGIYKEITSQLKGYVFRVTLVDEKGTHTVDVGTDRLVKKGQLNKPDKSYGAGSVNASKFLATGLPDDLRDILDIKFYKAPGGHKTYDQPSNVEAPTVTIENKQDNSQAVAKARRRIKGEYTTVMSGKKTVTPQEELDLATEALQLAEQALNITRGQITDATGGVDIDEYRNQLQQKQQALKSPQPERQHTNVANVDPITHKAFETAVQTVADETLKATTAIGIDAKPVDALKLPEIAKRMVEIIRERASLQGQQQTEAVKAQLQSLNAEEMQLSQSVGVWAGSTGLQRDIVGNINQLRQRNPSNGDLQAEIQNITTTIAQQLKLYEEILGTLPAEAKKLDGIINEINTINNTLPPDLETANRMQIRRQELSNEEKTIMQSIHQWKDSFKQQVQDTQADAFDKQERVAPQLARKYQGQIVDLVDQAISLSQQLEADPQNTALQSQMQGIVNAIAKLTGLYKDLLVRYNITTKGFLGNEYQKKVDIAQQIYENPTDQSLWANVGRVPDAVKRRAEIYNKNDALFKEKRDASDSRKKEIEAEMRLLAKQDEEERKLILAWVQNLRQNVGTGLFAGLGNSGKKFKLAQGVISSWGVATPTQAITASDIDQEREQISTELGHLDTLRQQAVTQEQIVAGARERVQLAERRLEIERELANVDIAAERKAELETELEQNKTRARQLGAKVPKFAAMQAATQDDYLLVIGDLIDKQTESDQRLRELGSELDRQTKRLGALKATRTEDAVVEGRRRTQDSVIRDNVRVLAEKMVSEGFEAIAEYERLGTKLKSLDNKLADEQYTQERYVHKKTPGYQEGWSVSQLEAYVKTLPFAQADGFDFEDWLYDSYDNLSEKLAPLADNPHDIKKLPDLKNLIVVSRALEELTGQEWLKPFTKQHTHAFGAVGDNPYDTVISFIQRMETEQQSRIDDIVEESNRISMQMERTRPSNGFREIYEKAEDEHPITEYYDYPNPHEHQQQAIQYALQQKAEDYVREHMTSEDQQKAIDDAIKAQEAAITAKQQEIEAERARNKEIVAERERLKAEGHVTDEMIAARRTTTEALIQEAVVIHKDGSITETTYEEAPQPIASVDSHYQNYTTAPAYQYVDGSGASMGVYGIDVSKLATEDTLNAIYTLLSGDTSRTGLSGSERKKYEDELAAIAARRGGATRLSRNDKDPTDLDLNPSVQMSQEIDKKLLETIGKSLSLEELRKIIGGVAGDLFVSQGDPTRKLDRDEFYEKNYKTIFDKALVESQARLNNEKAPEVVPETVAEEATKASKPLMTLGKAINIINQAIGSSTAKTTTGMTKAYAKKIHDNAEAVEAAKLLYSTPDSEFTSKYGRDTKKKLMDFHGVWANAQKAEKPKVPVQPVVETGAVAKEVKQNAIETPVEAQVQPVAKQGGFTTPDGAYFESEQEYQEFMALLAGDIIEVDIKPNVQPGAVEQAIDESVANTHVNVPIESTSGITLPDGSHFDNEQELREYCELMELPFEQILEESKQQVINAEKITAETSEQLQNAQAETVEENQQPDMASLEAREAEIRAILSADDKLKAAQNSDAATSGGLLGAMNELAKDTTLHEILTAIGEIAKRQVSSVSGKGNSAQDLLMRILGIRDISVGQDKERVAYMDLATGAITDSIEGRRGDLDNDTLKILRQAYQGAIELNAQLHTHGASDNPEDQYFSAKDFESFKEDFDKGIKKQILVSTKGLSVLDLSDVASLDKDTLTKFGGGKAAYEAMLTNSLGARYVTQEWSSISPQSLIKLLGIKGIESRYTESETRDSAVHGMLEEDAKVAADMLQESTGRAIKKTVERVGAELMTTTEKTDAKGNKTWSKQINDKYTKAALATNKAFTNLGLDKEFGIGTDAQLALVDYQKKYTEFLRLTEEFKKNPKQEGLQAQFDKLLPELDAAEEKLNKLIISKDRFLGGKEAIKIFEGADLANAGDSLKSLATSRYTQNSLSPGDNIAFNGISETPNGTRLLVDVLKDGTIQRYALEVDRATGQVKEFTIAEAALANAFQNVNKAMRNNETVMANVAIGDDPIEQAAFMSGAHSASLDAYRDAMSQMEQYVADIWNRMAQGGASASKDELDYIMALSERVIALGKNVQKTSIDFKNFRAQNPDNVFGHTIYHQGGDRDERVREELEKKARSYASANNAEYGFSSFDNDTLQFTLTDAEGSISRVTYQWNELYQQIAMVSDKSTSALDPIVAKINRYDEALQQAVQDGYLMANDSNFDAFHKATDGIRFLVDGIKNGHETFDTAKEKLAELRQEALKYGEQAKKTVAQNKRLFAGTGAKKQVDNQYNKIIGTRQAGGEEFESQFADDSHLFQQYIDAYTQLNTAYQEYVKNHELNNPEIQKQIQQQAAQVQLLGRNYLTSVKEAEELKNRVSQSGQYKDIKTGQVRNLGGTTDVTAEELTDLKSKMLDFVQDGLKQANVEGVKFDAVNQKLTYTFRTSKNSVADMVVQYNDATKALYAYNKQERESLTGLAGFMQSLKAKTKSILQYTTSITSIYRVWGELRRGIQYIREIDKALVELRKVTDETEETYDRFLKTASKTAGELGSTVANITQATATFAKLGYDISLASEMAKAAVVYQNVGDGIDSADAAAESIISTMKGFGIEANASMQIVDKFNQVGNEFSITSKGIGDALQRSASALSEGGNSIDESIGLITAANSVVQDPESVGKRLCRH